MTDKNLACYISKRGLSPFLFFDPHRGMSYQQASKFWGDIWHKKLGAVKLNVTADWEDSWEKNRCDDVKFIPFM